MRQTPTRLLRCVVLLSLAGTLATIAAHSQSTKENADFKLAVNLFNDKLFDLAAEQFKQFLTNYPASSQAAEARFSLGQAQLTLRQYDESRLTFQTFALSYPENPKAPDAWWNVGESYGATGINKEAALAFERVKMFHPKSKNAAPALVQASKFFRLAGENADARRVLRMVLQEYGSSPAALVARAQLAQMYFDDGNLDQAQTELKRVIEADPSPDAKAQALLLLGKIHQAGGRSEQAQTTYQDILTKHKTGSAAQGALISLAKIEASSGRLSEAVERYKKGLALARSEKSADTSLAQEAMIGLGDAYTGLRDYPNAVSAYESFLRSYKADSRIPDVMWKAAFAGSNGKEYQKSNELCSRILKSTASDILKRRALVRLARNAVEQGSYQQATQYYATFLEMYPDDPVAPEVIYRIGSLYETEIRDPRNAGAYYEQVFTRYSLSPFADEACFAGARCYEQLRDFDRAAALYRQLVQFYPASDVREQADDRLKMLGTFELKDVNSAVDKLASTVGTMVEKRDLAGQSFQLGSIYFNDLKNYAGAAEQFEKAIKAGLGDTHAVDALFWRAKSFEYLSWKAEPYRQQAVEAYQSFLQLHPQEARSGDAAAALFDLRATTLPAARQAYDSTISAYPHLVHRDAMLLKLGGLQEKADSAFAALSTYRALATAFPNSPSASEAKLRTVALWLKLGMSDSVATSGLGFLGSSPPQAITAAVLSNVGDLFIRRNLPQRAIGVYQKLAGEFGYTVSGEAAHRKLADAYLAGGKHDSASVIYAELLERQERNPLSDGTVDKALLLALARTQHAAGSTADAKRNLQRILATEQKGEVAGEAFSLLGMISKAEGSVDMAASYFKQAGVIAPASAASREVADLLFNNGNFTEAIKRYQQLALAAKSDEERRYCNARIVISRLRSGELSAADKLIADFTLRYKDADADIAEFELEKGIHFFRKEDYANSRRFFDIVADKYDDTPSAPVALYWIGKTLEATNKPLEAIDQFNRLQKKYPGSAIQQRVHFALGNIYYNAEKWDESIQNYRRVVDDANADPSLLPSAMSNLIETYEAAGINDAALALTRKYLDRFPSSEDALDKKIKIGILYTRLGYFEQAILQLQGLLDQAGSDLEGEIRYYIADANFNKGDYQQAILDFLKVPYLVTKKGKLDWTANSLYMAGQAYEKTGRFDQALTMYQQIIDRPGLDATYKAAAQKEVTRVKLVLKK